MRRLEKHINILLHTCKSAHTAPPFGYLYREKWFPTLDRPYMESAGVGCGIYQIQGGWGILLANVSSGSWMARCSVFAPMSSPHNTLAHILNISLFFFFFLIHWVWSPVCVGEPVHQQKHIRSKKKKNRQTKQINPSGEWSQNVLFNWNRTVVTVNAAGQVGRRRQSQSSKVRERRNVSGMSELISAFSHFALLVSISSPLSFCPLLLPAQLFLTQTYL